MLVYFAGVVFVLGLIPGPNVGMIVANSIAYGTRYGLVSVAGTSAAMVPQLAIATMGASIIFSTLAEYFDYLRFAGALYLFYIGIMSILHKEESINLEQDAVKKIYKRLFWRAFWVSMSNPKTILFFIAFLPGFIVDEDNILTEMSLLSVTFIFVISFVDSLWALLAGKVRTYLEKYSYLRFRISGGFYLIASICIILL